MSKVVAPRRFREGEVVRVDSCVWPTTSIETVRASTVLGKFQTFFFLEGEQSFWLDERFFHVDAGHGRNRRPKALTFALNRDTEIRLLRGTSQPLNKVSVTSPINWMEQMKVAGSSRSRELADFMGGHLNARVWEPGPEILAMCDQVSTLPKWLSEDMWGLHRSARGLDMLISICQRVSGDILTERPAALRADRQHMERVRDYLVENLFQDLSIGMIAQNTGTSVRSLQRKFRNYFGETVFDYVRSLRLDRARDGLIKDQLSVSEAAAMAGYSSVPSFSTAFKNRFGDTPRNARDHQVVRALAAGDLRPGQECD